jgi:excisionase family DNA binding protein
MSADRLLDAREVAEFLHINVSHVRELTRRGELPCVRFGRYVRYRRESLLAWIEARESGTTLDGVGARR